MDYERARELAEEAVFDWYGVEPGWYDSLPADAIEELHEQIARTLLRAQEGDGK